MPSYPQEAQKPLGAPKGKTNNKKYPGFYPCFWHDVLSEMFKEQPNTLCRKCYSNLLRHHVQFTAQNLIQIELIRRHLNEIDRDQDRLEARMNAIDEKEDS